MVRNEVIKNAVLKLINIKGIDEEKEEILLNELVFFVKSFVKLFSTIKTCFLKK